MAINGHQNVHMNDDIEFLEANLNRLAPKRQPCHQHRYGGMLIECMQDKPRNRNEGKCGRKGEWIGSSCIEVDHSRQPDRHWRVSDSMPAKCITANHSSVVQVIKIDAVIAVSGYPA